MLSRKRILLAAAATCAALAVPSVASAEDFCVGGPAGCSGTPVAKALLKQSLTDAQSNGTDDRFFLAPGVFASDKFAYQSGERVQLIGAGAGKTIVRGKVDGSVLELGGNPDSSVSDVTVEATGAATGGLTLKETRAHRVAVDAEGAPSLIAGVLLFGDATFDAGSVDIGGLERYAVLVFSGAAAVTDSTLSAPAGAGFVSAGSEVTLRRSTLDARFGAIAASGHLTVSDTLVDLRGHTGNGLAAGVYVSPNSGGIGTAATADADRVTIVGSTPGTADTVGVAAVADGAGKSAAGRVRDSVISGIGVPVGRQADNGATVTLTTTRSAYPSPVTTFDSGPGTLIEQNRLKVSPGFVGNGDFHLAAGSQLIDAGTPGGLPANAADRDGNPRASDGDGDCRHISDIGAFEYQGTRVRAVAAAATTSVAAGRPARFTATGSCVPGPEAPTVRWAFDDGATASGAAVTHVFQSPGRHSATVTVSDRHGHAARATAAVAVAAPVATEPPSAGPRISRLRVTPKRVRIGRRLPKLARSAVRRPLATIGFRLSKRATVTLRFAKLTRNGKPRPLKTTVRIKARKGRNRIRFAARLSRTVALTHGSYRLTARATDNAGLRSKRTRTRFTAIKPVR